MIKPFEVVRVQGITKVKGHHKQVHTIVEPKVLYSGVVLAIPSYSQLKPGSSKVSVGLRNYSCRTVTIRAKSVVATISAANVIPGKLAAKESGGEVLERERKGKMPPKWNSKD